MQRFTQIVVVLFLIVPSAPADDRLPKPLVSGLKNPDSAAIGPDGRIYVTCMGGPLEKGNGAVVVIEDGKARPFATGLDHPKGIAAWNEWLFVADTTRVWRIDKQGKPT